MVLMGIGTSQSSTERWYQRHKPLLVALCTAAALTSLALWARARVQAAMVGPAREYPLAGSPPGHLTEGLALEYARACLRLDGPRLAGEAGATEWEALRDGRSSAPDGRRDEFLCRNSLDAGCGTLRFRAANGVNIFVEVRLLPGKVVCQCDRGK